MARPRICWSLCCNPPSTGKDKLADNTQRALTNSNDTPIPTSAIFCVSIPTLSFASIPAFAPTLSCDSELFKQFIKAYLGTLTLPASSETREKDLNRPFKAKKPDLYYENLYIGYYYFCCQCKDHFETAGSKSHKPILFAALFFWESHNFCWQQHEI